jgi:hypothetical protein
VAQAQVLQLPTYRQFAVGTTVVVPDRGWVHLGGNGGAAVGGSQFGALGVPLQRAAGAHTSAGGMSISATIHDFEAMDRTLLEQAAARRGNRARFDAATPEPHWSHDAPPASVAEIRRQHAAQAHSNPPAPLDDAGRLITQGDAAVRMGNRGAARVYYQMAARRAAGPLQATAQAKYDKLRPSATAGSQAATSSRPR